MRQFIEGLMYENESPSLTRIAAVWGVLLFTVVTFWVVYARYDWRDYATFGALTIGGGLTTIVANKGINSKYNSPLGSPGEVGKVI